VNEYLVGVRLISHHHPCYIGYNIRLVNTPNGSLFNWCPPDLGASSIQYRMCCPADCRIHSVDIQSVSALSDSNIHTIFNTKSSYLMHTVNTYSICVRLNWHHHSSNIYSDVRLTNAHSKWIFDQCPPNPTAPPTEYLIRCPANQCIQ